MNRFLCLILGFIFFFFFSIAQENGFIKFSDTKTWVIGINDSIYSSDQIVSLAAGVYNLKARPQISYNWPSIYVEDEVKISAHDTVFYSLEKNISFNENIISQQQLPETPFTDNVVTKNINDKSYLKDGILMGAVAAK